MLFSMMTMAQQTPANRFFDKYSGQEGYTSVYITQYMFDLFAKVANESEDKEFHEITSKLKAIKILTIDSALNAQQENAFEKALISALPPNQYKEMMIVKDGKETVKFLLNEKNGKISEFLMIVYGDSDAVLITLEGDIDLKKISKLSKTMNVDGFEHLEKIEE